ncbi:hypothetical protein GT347_13745 [Xylophilus rhododendri]|uniref:Uncharacterized protein n=1 Tax=Xylophilus rhododendri TaxID=2697032 RepID=A0A857J848_9BURK|nr:hypothetical protein [Xylophilus rhododendri]QHI98955.1 hypothetical protein GT347_13745 [Xylophilus rhododendri]
MNWIEHLTRFGAPTGIVFLAGLGITLLGRPLVRLALPRGSWGEPTPGEISQAAAAQCLSVLLMGLCYAVADRASVLLFLGLGIGCALSMVCLHLRWRQLHRRHTCWVAEGGPDAPLRHRLLPMGAEAELYEQARLEWQQARVREPELSLCAFVRRQLGVSRRLSVLWPPQALAATVERLEGTAMWMLLCGANAAVLVWVAVAAWWR